MSAVYTAVGLDNLTEFGDFFLRRILARHINQTRAEPQSTVFHRFAGQLLHYFQLLRRSVALFQSHDGDANCALRHERRNVDARLIFSERI